MTVSTDVLAAVTLPNVFGDNMVLQRDQSLPVWGWDAAGQAITVTIGTTTRETRADAAGKWRLDLPAMSADGKTYQMTVRGSSEVTFSNVVVGEVWLCSGQSNMQMGLTGCDNGPAELAAANHPNIRLLHVKLAYAGLPQPNFAGKWAPCTPEAMAVGEFGGFSAAGYYFARKLTEELKVPVGVINASWGGTMIEPWTPIAGLKEVPRFRYVAAAAEKQQAEFLKPAAGGDPVAASVGKLDVGQVGSLYNAMISPLVPYAIRGALWYQGEANVAFLADGANYAAKQRAMVEGWRKVWGQGEFPFYYAQLAPHAYNSPGYKELQIFWEAQTAAQAVPNTGMVITRDITSDVNDIHPKNKKDVGLRLAAMALHDTYGRSEVVCRGPAYKAMRVEGDKVVISFDHCDGGLVTADKQSPDGFLIAGVDGAFVPATTTISSPAEVTVSSSAVKEPIAVRFAWSPTAQPNLRNGAGLPANSFRTDSPVVKSLAYGKPVTAAGDAQGDHVPENVTDGITDDSSGWHVLGPNRSITVDLESAVTIDRVVVYPYYDGRRSYRYTAEISQDGKTWTQIADMTAAKDPETPTGHEHRFAATLARYVRVTMLSNTANVGLHLNEILVFAPNRK